MTLAEEIRERSGQDINSCYQCHKCSGGCPVTFVCDLPLSGLVRALQLGLRDVALASRLVWLCSGCRACFERCPNGIDGARVLDALKAMAKEADRVEDPQVAAFHDAFLGMVRRFGRAYELGMMAEYKLRTGTLTQDVPLGMKMMARRKLRLLPSLAPRRGDLGRLFREGVRYRKRQAGGDLA
ncbi:MAG: 4Fe-4S dicluster domain-containing protein [Firmicutes bacterium]|nr:4Fe-4S dicluster domain-containing protein [Bacillota bacterium]